MLISVILSPLPLSKIYTPNVSIIDFFFAWASSRTGERYVQVLNSSTASVWVADSEDSINRNGQLCPNCFWGVLLITSPNYLWPFHPISSFIEFWWCLVLHLQLLLLTPGPPMTEASLPSRRYSLPPKGGIPFASAANVLSIWIFRFTIFVVCSDSYSKHLPWDSISFLNVFNASSIGVLFWRIIVCVSNPLRLKEPYPEAPRQGPWLIWAACVRGEVENLPRKWGSYMMWQHMNYKTSAANVSKHVDNIVLALFWRTNFGADILSFLTRRNHALFFCTWS